MTEDGEDPIDLAQRREKTFLGPGRLYRIESDGTQTLLGEILDGSISINGQETEKTSGLGNVTIVIGGGASGDARRIAEHLSRTTRMSLATAAGALAALDHVATSNKLDLGEFNRLVTRTIEPPPFYERGKRKAQWKSEQNRGRR